MKTKLKFKSIRDFNYTFSNQLKLYSLIKNPDFSKSNTNSKNFINSVNKEELKSAKETLKQYQSIFYKRLLNLHFNLQYSILSLITNKRLNLFNYEIYNILNNIIEKSCIEQEILSLIIDSINKDSLITKDTKNLYDIVQKKI